MLDIQNIICRIGDKKIIEDISAVFEPGLLHVIVGPNGSGKSTFLKIFSGELRPNSGSVYYDGQDIYKMDKITLAKRRAVMSQLPELHFPLNVDEVVMMGRYPHFTFRPSANDHSICQSAIQKTAVNSFVERDYLTLSGGEKQRVQFARVLAQIWESPAEGNRYLFLDEPISSLDIYYQHEFLQIVRSLKKEKIIIVAVLHDINLAMQYADRIIFMKSGKIVREGAVPGIVTADLINEVFDVPVDIISNPCDNSALIVYNSKKGLTNK